VTGMDLVGYMAKDVPRAIAFYRDVIGMQPTKVFDENAGAEFELSDGSTFGIWSGNEMMPFQTSNTILFAVDDFDAAVERMNAKNVPIVMQHESPVCFMAIVNDTEGNTVILHKRKPS
jgi:predicted enzyme related to lactoylglutathione lyase